MTTLQLDGTKIGLPRHKERVEAWLRGERVAPVTIDMALTQKCQLSCVYCYAGLQQNPSEPVPWPRYAEMLDDCVTIGHKPGEGVKAISLVSDGESTLNKDFYRFIARARYNGIDIACGTNGIALKREEMPLLVDSLTYLRINLSAAHGQAAMKIMRMPESAFARVVDNIIALVRLKGLRHSKMTIGLQMVLMSDYLDQVVPLAKLGAKLGVDFCVIKHCTDDEAGRLGVNYDWYRRPEVTDTLKAAEALSTSHYSVQVKWSKIKTGRDREYTQCLAPPLHLQMSGSGVVAPCGSFFHPRYKDKWIGDIKTERFKDIWASERYWEVMNQLRTPPFNPQHHCATLCLQDRSNLALFNLLEHGTALPSVPEEISGPNFL